MKETISMRPVSASAVGFFSPPAITGVPRITESILREARVWTKFARIMGARFSVETKAQRAIAFSARAGMSEFALPSKLEGTSRFQANIQAVAKHLDDAPPDVESRTLRLHAFDGGRVATRFGQLELTRFRGQSTALGRDRM